MWQEGKTWVKFSRNILAAEGAAAILLAQYLVRMRMSNQLYNCLHVFDINRNKVIRKATKVRSHIQENSKEPFHFVVCLN
ncbi:MAG: hypothetical protein EBZ77_05750 [Chitinophagia bacterium]|nr:hypothetical protein [Chitinophagia bacterium]